MILGENGNIDQVETFQHDLIKNGYHFFDAKKIAMDGYYPKQLLGLVPPSDKVPKRINVDVGDLVTTRAFFAISKPIDSEVEYQSGRLDIRVLTKEGDEFTGELCTTLPPKFILRRGSVVRFKIQNVLSKQAKTKNRKQ